MSARNGFLSMMVEPRSNLSSILYPPLLTCSVNLSIVSSRRQHRSTQQLRHVQVEDLRAHAKRLLRTCRRRTEGIEMGRGDT
jgi:hypothetical protein